MQFKICHMGILTEYIYEFIIIQDVKKNINDNQR